TPSQMAADARGRKCGLAKACGAPIAFEQLQGFQEMILGPPVVARPDAGRAQVPISRHLEWNIPKRLGNGLGVLAEREGFRRMTRHPEVVAQMDGQLAESPLIVERPGQAFGFAEIANDPFEFSERKECSSKVEAKVDGLLQPLPGPGQLSQGDQ